MLILSRRVNERIIIGNDISVSVIEIKGDTARIGIDAPSTVSVHRSEVYEAIQAENRAAAQSPPTNLSKLKDYKVSAKGSKASLLLTSKEVTQGEGESARRDSSG